MSQALGLRVAVRFRWSPGVLWWEGLSPKTIGALRQEDWKAIVDKKTQAQEVAAHKDLDAAAKVVCGRMGGSARSSRVIILASP